MLASQIPTKFSVPFANSAGGSYIRAIPTASQIGIVDGAASLTDGFPPLNFLTLGAGGIPPFGQDMTDGEVAAVVSYIRNSWGNSATLVTPSEVNRYRTVPLD